MKRYTSFITAILATIYLGVQVILEIVSLTKSLDVFSESGLFLVLLILAIIIVSLIFNAFMIPISISAPEKYHKRAPVIVVTIVFNFLLLFVGLGMFAVYHRFYYFLLLAISIAANIFYIIDKNTEKARLKTLGIKVEELGKKSSNNKKSELQNKIDDLTEMKAQGLITDTEYEELKKSYIAKELEK